MRLTQSLTLAPLLACAFAQNTIFLPFGAEGPDASVSVVGTGSDGKTTYVVSVSPESDFTIPPVTFAEGSSEIILPTQAATLPADNNDFETLVLYESCNIGNGGIATCLVSEAVDFDSTSTASIITQTATLSAFILSATGAPAGQPGGSASQSAPSASDTGAASSLVPQNGVITLLAGLLMFL